MVGLPGSEEEGVFVGGIAFSLQESGFGRNYREKSSPEFLLVWRFTRTRVAMLLYGLEAPGPMVQARRSLAG